MILLAEFDPQMLFIMGILLVMTVMLRRAARGVGKSATTPKRGASAAESTPRASSLDRSDQQGAWEVQMHDTARDLLGRLDSKILIVEQLLRDAERSTAKLEVAIADATRLGVLDRPESSHEDAASIGEQHLALHADNTQDIAADRALAAQRREIHQLAEQGLAACTIAERLGAPLGEVELMLSVHPKAG